MLCRLLIACAFCLLPLATAAQDQFSPAGKEAFQKLQQDDLRGAIELLEEGRDAGAATPVDLALLGTLYLETGRASEAMATLGPVAGSAEADPAVLYNAGRAALAVGLQETAIGYFERSVQQAPGSPAARELGLLRGAQGQITEAYRLLRPWAMQNPDDLEARLATLAAALQLGRPSEAEPLLEGLPEDDPRIRLLRGQFLSLTGDLPGAIEALEPLAESLPAEMRGDVLRLLADNYIDVGRAADAQGLLDGRVGQDPRLALLLAEAQYKEGETEAALTTLAPFAEPILTLERATGPIVFQLALNYGNSLATAGRAADAVPYLELATRLDPQDQLGWKGLGDALRRLGRRDEAVAALEKFRSLATSDAERRKRADLAAGDPAGKSLMEAFDSLGRGEPEKALAILRQEIPLSPADPRLRIFEIRVLIELSRLDEALATTATTLELFPGHPDALYQRGVVQMALEAPQAAEQDFRQALEVAPEHLPSMNDLAVLLLVQGRKEEARALLERVLALEPEHQLALENLNRLKQDGG